MIAFFRLLSFIFLLLIIKVNAKDSNANVAAYLNLTTTSENNLIVSIQNAACDKCRLTEIAQINAVEFKVVAMDTRIPYYYFFISNRINSDQYCAELQTSALYFGENGTYSLKIFDLNGTFMCVFTTLRQPNNVYEPIYVALAVFCGAALCYASAKCFYKRVLKRRMMSGSNADMLNRDLGAPILAASSTYLLDETTASNNNKPSGGKLSTRMKSVDVLRGICLAIMMFANYGAGDYIFLDHEPWNGLHLADTVFPCFIFIMGISIPFSFRSFSAKSSGSINNRSNDQANANGSKNILFKILKRTVLLFFFGLLTSNASNQWLADMRIMGVLQRFALSYYFSAILELIYFRMNGFAYVNPGESVDDITQEPSRLQRLRLKFIEFFYYPLQWLIVTLVAILWLVLTFFLAVDGCPTGYLGPGGLHENGSYFNCTGGAAGYIDRMVLGARHLYQYPTCNELYGGILPYDPEGLLGTLNSCILTYLGVSTGHIILHYKSTTHRIVKFLFYAVLYGLIALILCKFSKNDGWIPINKNMWSLSFILAIASISFFSLTLLYVLVDLKDVYSGTPFLYFCLLYTSRRG